MKKRDVSDVVVWTLLVAALCAIAFSFFIVNGLPPKDYLALFGIIAVGLGIIILIVSKLDS